MSMRHKFMCAACGSILLHGFASAAGLDLSLYTFDPGNQYSVNVARKWYTIPLSNKSILPRHYALPSSALLISASKNDFQGAGQLAKGCGVTLAASYALQSIFSLPDGHSLSPRNMGSVCSAAYLQNRYGSSYGIPALSLAASLDRNNIQSIPEQLGEALLPSLLSFYITRHFTERAEIGGGMSLNENGVMRNGAANGVPLLRLNLGPDPKPGPNKPGSNVFIQIDKNKDDKTRVMLGWQARF